MICPLSLHRQSSLTILQFMINVPEESRPLLKKYLLNEIQSGCLGILSMDILQDAIALYPSSITNSVLLSLVAPSACSLDLSPCSQISFSAIIHLCKRCSDLQHLSLPSHLIFPKTFGWKSPLVQITTLVLAGCSTVDDAIVLKIFETMMNLKSLDISDCRLVSDNSFFRENFFAWNEPLENSIKLEKINLEGCRNVTSKGIEYLTYWFGSSLTSINISLTGVDCLSLIFLSGYKLVSAISLLHDTKENILLDELEYLKNNKKEAQKNCNTSTHLNSLSSSCLENTYNKLENTGEIIQSFSSAEQGISGLDSAFKCQGKTGNHCEYLDGLANGGATACSCVVVGGNVHTEKDVKFSSENEGIQEPQDSTSETLSNSVFNSTDLLEMEESVKMIAELLDLLRTDPDAKPLDWHIEHSYKSSLISLECHFIDFRSLPLGQTCLKIFANNNKQLENLGLTWKSLDSDILVYLAEKLPNLRRASLTESFSLCEIGLSCFLSSCKRLKNIDFQGIAFFGDIVVESLPADMESLVLAESLISDESLIYVARNSAATLKHLDLNLCENVTTKGVEAIAEACSVLQCLNIRQINITNQAISSLAKGCPFVSSLDISSIDILTDSLMEELATGMCCLRTIDISWNMDVTDVGVLSLLRHCNLLEKAILSGLKRMTSKSLLPLIVGLSEWKHSRSLINLKLLERRVLAPEEHYSSDEEFEDLNFPHRSTIFATKLSHLVLEYCDRVEDGDLAFIKAICRQSLFIKDYYGFEVKPKLFGA